MTKISAAPKQVREGTQGAATRPHVPRHAPTPPTPPATDVPSPPRRRGRPSRADLVAQGSSPALSRELILDRATNLAKTEPLGEISIVGLARELGVAPTLIHYYVGSHDALISGVANRYFKERVSRLQTLTGDWKEDLRRDATLSYEMGVEYGGVLRYMMSHNRFRLFQQVSAGETDYGVIYLDRLAGIFRQGGFAPEHAAIGFHLLSQYVMSSAYAEVSRQLPAFHAHYIRGHVVSHPASELPGAHYFVDAFSRLDSATSFPEGLRLLIDSFEPWREKKKPGRSKAAGR